jgi:hypothetical protein
MTFNSHKYAKTIGETDKLTEAVQLCTIHSERMSFARENKNAFSSR